MFVLSTSVRQPIANLILSNTARAGLTGFLKTLAREVAPDGVTVNSLQPGLHRTDRLVQLYADPDAVAQGIPAKQLGDLLTAAESANTATLQDLLGVQWGQPSPPDFG